MRRSIGVEVLVPNAFIKLNEGRHNKIYSLPLSLIEEYGFAVISTLNKNLESNSDVYLILNLGQEKMFREKFGEYFTFVETINNERVVNLNVDLEVLKDAFQQYFVYYENELKQALEEERFSLERLYADYSDDSYVKKRLL